MSADPVAVRVQSLTTRHQVLILLDLATARGAGRVAPSEIEALFDDLGLPRPGNTSATLDSLRKSGLASKSKGTGAVWRPSPAGRAEIDRLVSDFDIAALKSESEQLESTDFASLIHPTLRPSLAPPDLLKPVGGFLEDHPFDQNVFGMTRFPSTEETDPIRSALDAAREACRSHGLEFHLASDRAIVDDLWSNVAAHMWASPFGIAFIERTSKRGLNYNLTIEIGSMLMAGRRIALLKDKSVAELPSDLTGKIYREVDLTQPLTVQRNVHEWLAKDLSLGECSDC